MAAYPMVSGVGVIWPELTSPVLELGSSKLGGPAYLWAASKLSLRQTFLFLCRLVWFGDSFSGEPSGDLFSFDSGDVSSSGAIPGV